MKKIPTLFRRDPDDQDRLRDWLASYPGEGVVWHHPDGRMAKIKRRDVMTEEAPA